MREFIATFILIGLLSCNTKQNVKSDFILNLSPAYSLGEIKKNLEDYLTIEKKLYIDSICNLDSGILLLDSVQKQDENINYGFIENSILNYFQPNSDHSLSIIGATTNEQLLLQELNNADSIFPTNLRWVGVNTEHLADFNQNVSIVYALKKDKPEINIIYDDIDSIYAYPNGFYGDGRGVETMAEMSGFIEFELDIKLKGKASQKLENGIYAYRFNIGSVGKSGSFEKQNGGEQYIQIGKIPSREFSKLKANLEDRVIVFKK